MDRWLEVHVWPHLDPQLDHADNIPSASNDGGAAGGLGDRDLLLSPAWLTFLNLTPFMRRRLSTLLKRVRELRESAVVYPPENQIMLWSYLCDPADIKVVILGQDPYHRGQANGVAFSVSRDKPVPPSLRNIFAELERSVPGFVAPSHGCLHEWGHQGVLLLNTVLTVEEGKPGSHFQLGWQWFTNYVIGSVSKELRNCVFMLWGSKALEKAALVDGRRHLVLKAQHPSPLAARNQGSIRSNPPFLGCNHFQLANQYLEDKGRGAVDWSLN
ncbi:Uracil DNA glycosylase [Eptesicus fuscus gammaherpesvirus]|uniref:Uracil DNA glycosylase n=1 Tax=vespertilionid gammaherpesvirus 3 TaxID=2846598 RepID=A0A2D1AFC0_9GAMA|nr:Uracil DNA glycosylase [Eptesicus fuscus gammaherpesvirus]ATA58275.1 Uracil DNA glycosylase [Eptesicus fuscus gammaherpesvirus]WAH70919.1 uracil-DNA glycosylase [Eptesicus fuscus gammaherpesvirus]